MSIKIASLGPFTLAKTKIVLSPLPEKPITFRFFGKKSACAKKPESHTGFLVSGAHARLLSTFDRTVRSTSRAVGDSAEGHVPRDQKPGIIPVRGERAFTLTKKTVKNRRSFKKPHFGGGIFDSGFLQCLGVLGS